MASGDTIWILTPLSSTPPKTAYATLDVIEDASTPVATVPVLDFDTGSDEWAYWFTAVPSQYDGGGFTWLWKGGTDNTDTGTIEFELRIKPVADATVLTGNLGIDAATGSGISDTPPATPQNKLNYSSTGTLSHANAGSPSAGDYVVIAIKRDTVTDTNTGDAQLALVEIRET